MAVDVDDKAASAVPGLDEATLGQVSLADPVRLTVAAAVHVDADDALADVEAAAGAVEAADRGDDDARFTVDGAEDHELLWFGVQEIQGCSREAGRTRTRTSCGTGTAPCCTTWTPS